MAAGAEEQANSITLYMCNIGGEMFCDTVYHKIPIISPGLVFVQKALLLGLFSGELIFGGAYYWKEFCVSKWVGLDNKTASTNSPWAYIWEGLLSEGLIWGGGGLLIFSEFYGMFVEEI